VMIPSDPTLLEFGQWLELQRQFQE
jgi:hypothetical protein